MAYINHDLDDALRTDLLSKEEIPAFVLKNLGETHSQRINRVVADIITQSRRHSEIRMSQEILKAIEETRTFLWQKVYFHPLMEKESEKAARVISELYHFYTLHPEILMEKAGDIAYPKGISRNRVAVDYIASMTDNFALEEYKKYLLPKKWFGFAAEG